MSGVLLIVVPSTVFMGAAAFLPYPEADTTNRAIALSLFILLLAASTALTHNLYVALFDQRISRKRWTRIDDRLKSLGFRVMPPARRSNTHFGCRFRCWLR